MKKISFIIVLIIILVFSFGIQIGNIKIGKFHDFNDSHHKDVQHSVFFNDLKKNKLIVLNLWATWCEPCIEEIPSLNELQRKYRDKNILFYALSVDNDSTKLKNFVKKGIFKFKDITLENIKYRDTILAFLEKKQTGLIKSHSIPKTFVIENGRVIKTYNGMLSKVDFKELDSLLSSKLYKIEKK